MRIRQIALGFRWEIRDLDMFAPEGIDPADIDITCFMKPRLVQRPMVAVLANVVVDLLALFVSASSSLGRLLEASALAGSSLAASLPTRFGFRVIGYR